jgi:hypothetical protein
MRGKKVSKLRNLTGASAPTTPTKENPMREFLEDLIGCLLLFAMIPACFVAIGIVHAVWGN